MQPTAQAPTPTPSRTTRLRRAIGIDRAIAFTVLARGWSGLAGIVTVALIARFLSASEQGFYFTFGSLVALQLIFELGFSIVILQLATHECAHLVLSPSGKVTGDPVAHARLASVLQKSVRWYTLAAVLMVAFLVPAGIYFFSQRADAALHIAWLAPWCLVVLAAGLTFQIDPIFSFLEGCGYIASSAHARFWQAATGSLLAWAALASHHGLFAPAMMILGQAVGGLVFLFRYRDLLFGLFRFNPGPHRIAWRSEVWPFQWRIAVSFSCGYFIFQLFNPVLFAFRGPIVAGQMGMSLNITNALYAVAIAWVSTKAAPFGSLIARREFARLDSMFFKAVGQSTALALLGSLVLWSGNLYLARHGSLYLARLFAHRLLTPLPFGLLLIAMNVNQIVSAEALYLRAHKQEKFLLSSVVAALLMAASTYLLGRRYGALGVTAGYCAVALLVGLGMGTWIFFKYRRQWHAPDSLTP